jgi:hypothetical protein
MEGIVYITVTGDNVISVLQLPPDPAIKPGMKTKPERFPSRRGKCPHCGIGNQADRGIQAHEFSGDAVNSPPGGQSEKSERTVVMQGARVVIAHRAAWRGDDE